MNVHCVKISFNSLFTLNLFQTWELNCRTFPGKIDAGRCLCRNDQNSFEEDSRRRFTHFSTSDHNMLALSLWQHKKMAIKEKVKIQLWKTRVDNKKCPRFVVSRAIGHDLFILFWSWARGNRPRRWRNRTMPSLYSRCRFVCKSGSR